MTRGKLGEGNVDKIEDRNSALRQEGRLVHFADYKRTDKRRVMVTRQKTGQ